MRDVTYRRGVVLERRGLRAMGAVMGVACAGRALCGRGLRGGRGCGAG